MKPYDLPPSPQTPHRRKTLAHPTHLLFWELVLTSSDFFDARSLGADEMTIAFAVAMGMLPAVILAPIIGIVIDRINFRRLILTLLVVEISMTLCFITINSLEYVWILMGLMFIRSAAASMLFSAEMALFPRLISGEILKKTNEIHSIIWSFSYAAGMAVGGIVTDMWGYDGAFLIDAGLYLVALFIAFGLIIQTERSDSTTSSLGMIQEGFAYFIHNKKLLHLTILHASLGLTSFDALVTLLADTRYKEFIAVPLAIGWINAMRALALTIGPLLMGNRINHTNLHIIFILQGLGIILWSLLQGDFTISLIGLFVAGFFTTTLWSYTYLLIQESTPKEFLGRVISYNDMIFMIANVTIALLIGLLAKWGVALETITLLLGSGFFVVALYYRWILRNYL